MGGYLSQMGANRTKRETNNSPRTITDVKKPWIYKPTPQYGLRASVLNDLTTRTNLNLIVQSEVMV
jgi:hypothetical protein